MKKICITGANGFIGKSLCQILSKLNKSVVATVRSKSLCHTFPGVSYFLINDINHKKNWNQALKNCKYIIHCAGKTQVISKNNKLDEYHIANVMGTKNLAEQAAKAGVKRLIFLSTIKVNGRSTCAEFNNHNLKNQKNEKVFMQNDFPNPEDLYAKSKLKAEKVLWKIASRTSLEVVVLRLPLVYGYGAKGNLERLMKLINFQIPLPFKSIRNKRSLIGIDNLADVLMRCIYHPNAAGKTFLVSDGIDLSTSELIRLMASTMGRSARLFAFPVSLLKFFCFITGRYKEINRLVGSLQLDNKYICETLNWKPPISVAEGIRRMVKGI
jgi:nucleoside-diphosphate-sugar epimerase